MELDRAGIIESGTQLAVSGRKLQDQLDLMLENHPDNKEYKKMRDFLAERQAVLHDLLSRIPD